MKKAPTFLIKEESVTVILDGRDPVTVRKGQPNYSLVLDAIKSKDATRLEALIDDTALSLSERVKGEGVEVVNNQIFFNGEMVKGYLADKIINFVKSGIPVEGMLNFLGKLQSNPSSRAREELYKFLETEDLPITPTGNFLAYKAVKSNWMDKHSGTIDNSIGRVINMPREKVDDNQSRGCSRGLHAGSLQYVSSFGHGTDRYLIVEIDPEDVVCIPNESCHKLRCCEYKVVRLMDGEMKYHSYDDDGNPLGALKGTEDDYDQVTSDWEDDDDDFFDVVVDDSGWF